MTTVATQTATQAEMSTTPTTEMATVEVTEEDDAYDHITTGSRQTYETFKHLLQEVQQAINLVELTSVHTWVDFKALPKGTYHVFDLFQIQQHQLTFAILTDDIDDKNLYYVVLLPSDYNVCIHKLITALPRFPKHVIKRLQMTKHRETFDLHFHVN
jgi:hypothetical protein